MSAATFSTALAEAEAITRELFPERAQRIDDALHLIRDGRVFQRGDGEWEVDSVSHAGLRHHVGGHCDCPDFTYRSDEGPCKHQIAVMISKRTLAMLTPPTTHETPAPAQPAPLPEAPASANVKLWIGGKEVMLTLRGVDEAEVLDRVAKVIARYAEAPPTSQPFAHAGGHRSQPPVSQDEGWCTIHDTAMRRVTKGGRSWLSHWADSEGRYCTGKPSR
jgi:hypothetical protein